MSQPTVSGVAPTTGITLSDEDVGENARSAADMLGDPTTEVSDGCPARSDDLHAVTYTVRR
jgi:hypothetical protein